MDENNEYLQLMHSIKLAQTNIQIATDDNLTYLLEKSEGKWSLYPKQIYFYIKNSDYIGTYNYTYNYTNHWDQLKPKNPKDRLIITHLRKIYENDLSTYHHRDNNILFSDVFELLIGHNIKLKHEFDSTDTVYINPEPFHFLLEIGSGNTSNPGEEKENKGTNINLTFLLKNSNSTLPVDAIEVVSPNPCWIYLKGNLHKVEYSEFASHLFLNSLNQTITIPNDKIHQFLEEFIPIIQDNNITFNLDDNIISKKTIKPEPCLYLSEDTRKIKIEFRVAYGDFKINRPSNRDPILVPPTHVTDKNSNALIWSVNRDFKSEIKWQNDLLSTNLTTAEHPWMFTPEKDSLAWIIEHLPTFVEAGFNIYGEESLKKFAKPQKMSFSSFRITSGEQWFEIEGDMTFGDITLNINDISNILIKGKSYVKLQDDTTGELPENWLFQLQKLLHFTEPGKHKIRVPKIAANLIEELVRTAHTHEADTDFTEYAEKLRSFEKVEETKPPKKFKGKLRQYQQAGLSWMYFLKRYGFGGILADDMGLGKTVQVLALLQKIAESDKKNPHCLIVAPRSVLHN